MSEMTRRNFLKRSGTATAAAVVTSTVRPEEIAALKKVGGRENPVLDPDDQFAVLYDSTLCIGCRMCEFACNEANDLERSGEEIFQGRSQEDVRALAPNVLTYVTTAEEPCGGGIAFGKMQCMHCLEPACVAVCPVSAMEKTPEGPVVWHPDLCLGCRYCMMACPFSVPRFEWDSVNPEVTKCQMCANRIGVGETPACVEACPTRALTFGRRGDLLAEAHDRIQKSPRAYVHHVYGETEVGGTNLLHLAACSFETLGYKADLPDNPIADRTSVAMGSIPYVFNGLGVALGAIAWVTNRRNEKSEQEKGELK